MEVSGRARTPRAIYPAETPDIRLGVGRVYNPAGFDAMISLASRCAHYRFATMLRLDLTVLQNSHSANGLRIFRYAVTSTDAETPAQPARTEYTSYAMLSALIVSATATPGHQHELDTLFDGVVTRLEHQPLSPAATPR